MAQISGPFCRLVIGEPWGDMYAFVTYVRPCINNLVYAAFWLLALTGAWSE